MTQITESFNWLTPEFSILPTDKNTVKIKGVAMPPNTVSKNNKRYVDEELRMAARTWIDAPVTPNHAPWTDKHNQKGKVNWMEYDAVDGTMEYVAEVWDPTLVAELRVYKENPSASKIRGVSIEADYLHIRCCKCGSKFFSEDEWRVHMETVEHFKDLPLEPHGIRGRALSIVLAPETPGVQGNTLEVMETMRNGLSQLLDIIVTNNKIKEEHQNKMSRIALTQEQTHVVVGRSKTVNTNIQEQDEHGCGPDEHWDEEKQACVVNAVEEQEECPAGQHRDPDSGECVPDEAAEETVASPIPTTIPLLKEKIATFRLKENAPKLSLGEPFAGYTDFADCVAKNSEKDNPEAYCGSIKKETEGEMWFRKQATEKLNNVIDRLNTIEITVPQDDLGWKQTKPYNDKPLKEAIANIKPYDDAPLKAEVATLKEAVAKKDEDIAMLRRAVQIADENVTVKDKIAETKQKTLKEIIEKTEKLEAETKTLKEQLEKATVRADNAEDKLGKHSEFKGNAKTLEEKAQSQDLGYTPEQNIKEKHKK